MDILLLGLSSIGLSHASLATEQMLGLLLDDGAIGLGDTRLLVEKLAFGLLLERLDLARHGLVAYARLVARHSRTRAHAALGVRASALHRLVRLAAGAARVVVRAVLVAHIQAEIFHGAL